MDKVVHFEIPYDDLERAEKFYKGVFDWKIINHPEMKYNTVHTVEIDEKHMPKEAGVINGGMYKREHHMSQTPVIVIGVKDVDEAVKKAKHAGGTVFKEKVEIPKMGFYAQIKDTEGNIIGIWGEK